MRIRPRVTAGLLSCLLLELLVPAFARAQSDGGVEGEVLRSAGMARSLIAARSAALRTSAGPDPDTVYVGKSATDHTGPENYWNIYVGDYLPGIANPNNALWDWDSSVGIQAADSLHGWWPIRRQYNSTGGLTLADNARPWWALDHGNIGNYVISQQSSAKRTFGVVGMWHADSGSTAGAAVRWSPLAGSKSAWCGLRQHGDNTVLDAVTGQAFNQNIVNTLHDATSGTPAGGGGSGNNFPGYPDQIDQMLYRDIAINSTQSLTVSFSYRTRMSTSIGTTATTRTGWFHGDPLNVVAGNFISSTAAGTLAPTDSFMVYVGAPVNDAACVYSDNTTRPVYDKQRRWFSEVIKTFGAGATYFEIFSAAGNNPSDTLAATPSASVTVPAGDIASILGTPTGNVRLVFRCKTNRGFADSDTRTSGYTSAGRGAVQIDDVSVTVGGGSPAVIGDFEGSEQGGVNQIDNRFPLPGSLAVTDVWRSTGKPTPEYMHVEALSGLTYGDLCGPPDSPARSCNIGGLVVTAGNHDDGENASDSRFTAWREVSHSILSPTIDLLGDGVGGATPNAMGLTSSIVSASDDIILWYDMYAGMFNLSFSGNSWSFGSQSYPATQPNGAKCWGQLNFGTIVFNPEPQCFTDWEPFAGNGRPLRTSNPSGIPDSLRVFLAHQQQCFRFAISLGCNSNEGGYFDNVSVAFVDVPGVPGQANSGSTVSLGSISSDIWQFVNDAFPSNETPGLPGSPAFDTTSAYIKTGMNTAQATANVLRFDIPGDSSSIIAGNATVGSADDPALAAIRVDLVFRILPGPGNYDAGTPPTMPPGGSPTGGALLKIPSVQGDFATAGDGSYWGTLMASPGEVSAGTHNGGASWDHLTWNSVRMDTTELNIFRISGGSSPVSTGLGGTSGNGWMTMIHEADPRILTLGKLKNKCFTIVVPGPATTTGNAGGQNVVCDGTVPGWVTGAGTGYDGNAQTREFTKIIPDGLLTPGSHVSYFYRKGHAANPLLSSVHCPDTNLITPQNREGSTDQHRWQQFSVLPDRWKSSTYGGAGSACMLYVDWNDRRGDEGRFIATMDSIGATAVAKHGSHNGWFAPGTLNVGVAANVPAVSIRNQNAQPGTTFDMYGVKASESLTTSAGQLGSRLANRAGMGFAAGKEARSGPTPEMLRTYYRLVSILSGDLTSGVLGPFANRSQNDIALLNDYLTAAGGTAQPRGLFVQGNGFGQSEKQTGAIDAAHTSFLTDKLGLIFRSPSYISLSGNVNDCADLLTYSPYLTTTDDIYGVSISCVWSNDVFNRNPALPETQEGGHYEAVGLNAPYVSDVVKETDGLRPWVAATSGIDIEHLYGRYCDTDNGRLAYYYYMLKTVFAAQCPLLVGTAAPSLDTPQSGRAYTNFMKIGNSIMKQGRSYVRFSVAKARRVQVSIYDVTGRKIRNLADRVFPAGEHSIQWDGSDDSGSKVARGVYFVRSSVQKDAGRIIVLSH